MGQKDCGLSLIKKPCVRKRFPCSRCGAKIVNGNLAWEISVPKYKKWYYMEPDTLVVNGAATASPAVLTINRRLPYYSSETQESAPCKFDGPGFSEGVNIISGTGPGDYGDFVQDFEWSRFLPYVDGWNHFARTHTATVEWADAIVDSDSGEATTPGHWRIGLKIVQSVIYHYGTAEGNPILNQVALGENLSLGLIGNEDVTTLYATASTTRVYTPPDDYDCIIPPGEFSRWTRPVPTLPILWGEYTSETLPSGYTWPAGEEPGEGVPFTGFVYPIGFSIGDYYAPPYIDVRHVPK